MDFYLVLADIMDRKHLTIPEVARLCGLSDSTVRSIFDRKQKKIALNVAFKISEGPGVSLDELNTGIKPLEEKEPPSPEKSELGEDQELSKEDEELYLSLRAVLEKAKIVAPGEPLSPDQAQRVIAILQLIRLLFDKGTEKH